MPRIHHISRRTMLRGIGGIALGLPALEIMRAPGRAHASSNLPMRYFVSYVGTSTGRGYKQDGADAHGDLLVPDLVGAGYDLKRALLPLGPEPWQYSTGWGGDQPAFDVRDEVSIVSGLEIPWGMTEGAVPPGGRIYKFHGYSVVPQIAGTRATETYKDPTGATSDQLVADAIAGDTLHRSLVYRVQPVHYHSGADSLGRAGRMSWRTGDGNAVGIDPIVNPKLAWESLFTGFVPDDPVEAAKVKAILEQRKSVLDVVGASANDLLPVLGTVDRQRMERHFDEIRALEKRLDSLHDLGGDCKMLPDPGDNWPLGESNDAGQETEDNKYSNEEERAEVLIDLIHMAFVCDLSRVASLQFERWKSYLNMYQLIGVLQDIHDLSHWSGTGSNLDTLSDALAWHVKHFARLVRKLKDTPDVDGTPLIDRTVMAMLFEGGHGYDPDGGSNYSPHSTQNMAVLLAGGRAGGLEPGRHVEAPGRHPASVLVSGMQAVGADAALNDISDPIDALFG
jgi:hypothetical protein